MQRIAVIGAGFMGGGIGADLALRLEEVESVWFWDAAAGAAARAVERAHEAARVLVAGGIVAPDTAERRLDRLSAAPTPAAALEGATYVVEAVPEDLAIKREVYAWLDRLAAPDAILASNTSGYDPADLARDLTRPERLLVAHYFGPAYLIPLVEVVPHAGTAAWAVEQTTALLRQAGKRVVQLGQFTPGFVANRLQQALFREALSLVRQGIVTPEAVDEVVRSSFGPRLAALGPFAVADFAGLDVYAGIMEHVWPTLSNEPGVPVEVVERLKMGHKGTKTGAGFHEWPPERLQAATEQRDQALVAALRQDRREQL